MDYYPHLTETCPSGYAEEAQQSDLTKFTMDFVLDRAQTEWRTVSAECRNALVAYFAKDIGPQTEINNLRSWLRGIADYAGDMPSDLKADIREAICGSRFRKIWPQPIFPLFVARISISGTNWHSVSKPIPPMRPWRPGRAAMRGIIRSIWRRCRHPGHMIGWTAWLPG